jgi:hypothetical protein
LGFRIFVAWQLGEDTCKIAFVVFGDCHSPKTVLDVEFCKQKWCGIHGSGGHGMNNGRQDAAEFGHGFHWCLGIGGAVVDRGVVCFDKSEPMREVQCHPKQAALVGDGGDWANF